MKTNQTTSSILGTTVFFMFGSVYFVTIKYLGFSDGLTPTFELPCDFSEMLVKTMVGGTMGGLLIGVAEFIVFPRYLNFSRFTWFLLTKMATYSFIMGFLVLIVNLFFNVTLLHLNWTEATENAFQFFISRAFYSIFLHFSLLSLIFNFYRQARDRFGWRVLMNYFVGRYHRPFEEERIFMFLDLKSSTTIAEKLGHTRFSKLLQYAFDDLSKFVSKYRAEVYQYVGDEAVLTWSAREGLANANCLAIFFDFEKHLQANARRYLDEFGLVPEFKASLNIGLVTVTEVGSVHKEIAYHGDVLNTAARIQDLCNTYNKKLLISEYLEAYITGVKDFRKEFINSIVLRGKEQPVSIYTVSPF